MEKIQFRATVRNLEIMLIQGTPYEQNCVVLARPFRTNVVSNFLGAEQERAWFYDIADIEADIIYACKTWWNYYQESFKLQDFLNEVL